MTNKKLKTCPECGKEIGKSAKRCPFCDAKQKKKLKIWQIILIIFAVFIVFGMFGSDEESDSKVAVSSKETSSEEGVIPEIKETVIFEGNDVVITATGMEKSGNDWNLKLLIENNSSLNLNFCAHAYAVNGVMTQNNIYEMYCDVAAGKKANTELEIDGSVLKEYGISEIRCIDALFWAYDNDESFKSFDTDQIEIQTSLYSKEHDVVVGETIYEEDGIKVEYIATDGNDYIFSIKNTTGTYFDCDFNEVTINDYTTSDYDFDLLGVSVLNNSQVICTISVDDEFMEQNSIEDITSIQWNMNIRPQGDYFKNSDIGPIVYTVK